MKKDLMMVGSVPLETAEDVFKTCGPTLGKHLPFIPDGEIDERIWWVNMLAYRVFHGHPEIDTVMRPPPENGVEKWRPKDRTELWQFKVKDGVKQVHFGEPGWRLNYTKDAVHSYFMFRTMREKGLIPADVKFQVAIPLTNSAIDFFFHNPDDYPKIKPGFEAALRAEIAKMAELIPPDDLVIEWDCCMELMDLEGAFPWLPKTNVLERNVAPVANLSPHIPEAVGLGYHLCYGTLGGWPMVTGPDLHHAVEWSNAAVARSGRRVDFIHIPVLDTLDDAYYAPLKNLKIGKTAIYLGAIHNVADTERFKRRLALMKKYVPDFGLAAPCGWGRHRPHEVPAIVGEHLLASQLLAEMK